MPCPWGGWVAQTNWERRHHEKELPALVVVVVVVVVVAVVERNSAALLAVAVVAAGARVPALVGVAAAPHPRATRPRGSSGKCVFV